MSLTENPYTISSHPIIAMINLGSRTRNLSLQFGFHAPSRQLRNFDPLFLELQRQNYSKNKEERYSRVPRLSDTRYSAKWR